VAGLAATLGNGAMSNTIPEIEDAKCLLIFGYNSADSHPIVARRIVKAKEKGCKIVVVDPRKTEAARISDLWLSLRNGSNMALVNAFGRFLIKEGLYDKEYVANYTEGFDQYKEIVEKYTPEYQEKITGISPAQLYEAMHIYAEAPNSFILYGMGVTQWGQAVDVVKGLSGLALLTGNYGRRAVGIGPVRGQNNVQGACDMGALPNVYCGYQPVIKQEVRAKFEKAWGVEKLPSEIGCMLTQVPHRVKEGTLKAFYIFGEDPVQSDPDSAGVREALEGLDLVIVQDILMNKTALFADLILPATSWGEHEGVYSSADRGMQRFHKAIEPKGDVKVDWEIISLISTAMGYPMKYHNTEEIWDEMRSLCPNFFGVTYEKMERQGSVVWPCPTMESTGTPILYVGNKFSTPSGKGQLFASEWRPPLDLIDDAFPLVLSTVREVGHYSSRTMTGNCAALQCLADEPGYVQINAADAQKYGIEDEALLWISSRRGKVITRANITDRANKGVVYMTYQWWIGCCNELTIEHVDPISKTPEYKYSAVKIEAIADQVWAEKYLQDEYLKLREKLAAPVPLLPIVNESVCEPVL
jgi:formate dehydrogenase major subunit